MRRYTERISFTLPAHEKAELKGKAAAFGISMSEILRYILDSPDIDEQKRS